MCIVLIHFLMLSKKNYRRMERQRREIDYSRSILAVCDQKNKRYVWKRLSAVAPGLVPVWAVNYPDFLDNVTAQADTTFSGISGDRQFSSVSFSGLVRRRCWVIGRLFCFSYQSVTWGMSSLTPCFSALWRSLPWEWDLQLPATLLKVFHSDKTPHPTGHIW